MARAVELAAVVGAGRVDAALGLAAIAGRFADGDLASIIDHLAAELEIGGSWSRMRPTRPSPAPPAGPAWGRRQDDDAPPAAPGRGPASRRRRPHPPGPGRLLPAAVLGRSELRPAVRRSGAGHRPGR